MSFTSNYKVFLQLLDWTASVEQTPCSFQTHWKFIIKNYETFECRRFIPDFLGFIKWFTIYKIEKYPADCQHCSSCLLAHSSSLKSFQSFESSTSSAGVWSSFRSFFVLIFLSLSLATFYLDTNLSPLPNICLLLLDLFDTIALRLSTRLPCCSVGRLASIVWRRRRRFGASDFAAWTPVGPT